MAGPAKALQQTGTAGRHKANVKRDMIRRVGKIAPWYLNFLVRHSEQQCWWFSCIGDVLLILKVFFVPKVPLQMVSVPMKVHKLKKVQVRRNRNICYICLFTFVEFVSLSHGLFFNLNTQWISLLLSGHYL